MAEAQRPSAGAWRTYLELASGLGETSRKQVRKVVKDLVGKGNATAGQLRSMTGELLAANAVNREALGRLVKIEVDRALGRVGLATMDEVNELTARVRELERQLREARTGQATPTAAASARRGRPATKATASKATAAMSSATSPVVKKATRRSATAPVPAPTPATKATRAVKASAGKAAVAKAPAKAARTRGASQ